MGTRYTVKYIGPRLNKTRGQIQKKIDRRDARDAMNERIYTRLKDSGLYEDIL